MSKILKNLLADYGYNLVALPKADIKPLALLSEEADSVNALGNSLEELFEIDEVAPPQVSRNIQVSDLFGSTSVSYEARSGISVLHWLLDKLKMGKLEGKASFDSNKILTIKYENVLEDKVNLLDLDNFLSGSAPNDKRFNTYRQRLENSELYVISSILKSNAFTVTLEDKNGTTLDLDATIKGILEVGANVQTNKQNAITIKNENESPLVFAFKAQRLLYIIKEWWDLFNKDQAVLRIRIQTGIVLKDESNYPAIILKPLSNADIPL
jgi:hypothetical protein